MRRRSFLKLTGIAGILAAHRAPAFAQGTKLHLVRWVDFIPEADVELKRQAPEASKALGAEVTFESINANDLQPRITAAIQSGSGADIFMMLHNWPHLYANGLPTSPTSATGTARTRAATTTCSEAAAQWAISWLAVAHSTGGNADRLPQLVVRRDRCHRAAQDARRTTGSRQEAQGQGQAGRAVARPQLR